MELKVFKDTLAAAGGCYDAKAELPVETEILIPDYLPQVFKIVKCFVSLVVLQKQILNGRITLDGYLRCTVCYQAEEEQSLCQTEQKLPFTRTIDLAPAQAGDGQIQVGGEVEYLNCRAVNQRRIDVRGAYALSLRLVCTAAQEVVTAVSDCGAEQKTALLSGIRPAANLDKLITCEEEAAFPETPAAVLDIAGVGLVEEVKVISGKAVVKGKIQTRVLYRTGPGYQLETLRREVPFNHIVDLENVGEDCTCFASVEPVGCTLMAGQEGQTSLSVSALLHLRAWRRVECYGVADAFSTRYELKETRQTVTMEQLAANLDEQVETSVVGTLPDENAELLQCFVTLSPLELTEAGGFVQLRGRAMAHLLCMNSLGEIDCYDKAFEYTLPHTLEGESGQYRAECWAAPAQVSWSRTGGEVTVKASLQVTGLVMQRQTVSVLSDLACGEPLERPDPEVALRIYYARKGETLFDIAKRYHVSPNAIQQCNRLEGPALEQDVRLLVPMVV